MTLTDFLLARIGDDERTARDAFPAPWDYAGQGWVRHGDTTIGSDLFPEVLAAEVQRNGDGEHIARHDPARILAECAMKRRLIEDAADFVGEMDNEEMRTNDLYAFGRIQARSRSWQDHILRALAQPYSNHPDFDSSWADAPEPT